MVLTLGSGIESARAQVPWQVTAGVFEAERQIDTNRNNAGRELCYAATQNYTLSWLLGLSVSECIAKSHTGSNPAAGIANIHADTARQIALYCQRQQGYDPTVYGGLPFAPDASNLDVIQALIDASNNVRVMTTYVRILADYRFGSQGFPLIADHSNLSEWTITDAAAIWQGYRYGVPGVAPDKQGLGFNSLKDFQDRSYGINTLIYQKITGIGNPQESVLEAIPIFEKYFAMPR